MKLAISALRGLVGGLFIGHGAQKAFGAFGGAGLDATAESFEALGIRPARPMVITAGATEIGAGALLAAGLATPLASAGLIGTLTEAIRSLHARNGPWIHRGGWEYSAVMIAVLAMFAEQGPGPLSLDRALGVERRGMRWALAALAAGVAGPPLMAKVAAAMVGDEGEPAPGAPEPAAAEVAPAAPAAS